MKFLKAVLAWIGGFIAGCAHDTGKVLTQAFFIFFVATFGGAGLVSGGLLGWLIFKTITGAGL